MSSASSPCRIEWRPSRWAVFGAALIGALAALAIALGDVPVRWRYGLSALALVIGLHGAWREARRPRWTLVWPGVDANAQRIVGARIDAVTLRSIHLRGPLAGVTLNEPHGGVVHALWWPDTLTASSRRALVLCSRVLRAEPPPPA